MSDAVTGSAMAALEQSIARRLNAQGASARTPVAPGVDATGASADESEGQTPAEAKAMKSAKDFESFFIAQMLQPMFEGLSTEAPFGGGHAEEVWRSLMVDEYGKMISRAGGIGVTDQVMAFMLKNQEG
ncbi:rod-binding protein [Pararhodospirillum oryzae]|uniref:Flagellar protein FlgJ N-terminal domain-containing protein n=1 Tax=Pararhodospirillum oryzae TaxID=478448 RepID=A0A512H8P5_9PROT|nr:rod-binding protein [Pararhodospirillum oryzae]GEO81788.1 hypothetical protein ROR02_19190 [Pararhodospirillum oryzae]